MSTELSRRCLGFEKLERKELPSSTWILLAATDPHDQSWFEQVGETTLRSSEIDATSHALQPTYSTDELLHFIDEHTYPDRSPARSLPTPSPAQCAAADEMMKLDDLELRDLVLHSTFVIS